jgi:hypothetical protein
MVGFPLLNCFDRRAGEIFDRAVKDARYGVFDEGLFRCLPDALGVSSGRLLPLAGRRGRSTGEMA